jgi:hypothetical protein
VRLGVIETNCPNKPAFKLIDGHRSGRTSVITVALGGVCSRRTGQQAHLGHHRSNQALDMATEMRGATWPDIRIDAVGKARGPEGLCTMLPHGQRVAA